MENDGRAGVPVGARLRAARVAAALTQVELSRIAEIDQASISRYERGDYDEIGGLKLARLARALGVSMEWLATGEGDGPNHDSGVARAEAAAEGN